MEKLETKLKNGELPSFSEVEELCERAIKILILEPNVVSVSAPVKVIGDIHGQFYDLLNIFKIHGTPKVQKYIFLGDYVDRGFHGVETISLLLLYKVMYPHNITLLRGNHETSKINKVYGFYDEVTLKYGTSKVWRHFCEVFVFLNLACVVNGRVFCVHGGISECTNTINNIQAIDRFDCTNESTLIGDLMWSDPKENPLESDDIFSVKPNRRGTGCNFGIDICRTFCEFNDIIRIVRSHQLARNGYKFNFKDKSCVTVWSAPNYCYRYGNLASVMNIGEDLACEEYSFNIFKAVENQKPGFENVAVLKRK